MSIINSVSINRAERRKMQTHALLKQITTELLFSVGYRQLSIRAITESADVGYGTFYLHFADKDEAVWAVLYDWMEGWRIEVDRRLAHEVYPRREYLSWIIIFEQLAYTKQSFVEVFGRNGSSKLFQRYQDYLIKTHEDSLKAGSYSAGIDMSPEFLAQFVTGALMRIMVWWAEGNRTETPTEMARLMYQVVYRQSPPE